MAYLFAVVTTQLNPMTPAMLCVRLLALLDKIQNRAAKEDVHQIRTTVRRLEAQLGESSPKIAKALRRLRRKAGRVRDIDVHLDLLKSAPGASARRAPGSAAEWKELRRILKSSRCHRLASLRDLVEDSVPLLVSKLPALAERAATPEITAAEAHQRVSRAQEQFLQWTNVIPDDAAQFHRLRISAKNLRYSLEPLASHAEAAELVGQLKLVQDAIGYWHDWATLQQLAEEALSSPAARPVCAALRARAAREFRKAYRVSNDVRIQIAGRVPVESVPGASATPQLIRQVG